jgi:hypothetical protein
MMPENDTDSLPPRERLNTFAAFTTIYRGLRDLTTLRYKGGVECRSGACRGVSAHMDYEVTALVVRTLPNVMW